MAIRLASLRGCLSLLASKNRVIMKPVSRRHSFCSSKPILFYRDQTKPDPKTEAMGDQLMTLIWAWLFYHIINNGHTLLGEDVFPDPKTFTNEELGVE